MLSRILTFRGGLNYHSFLLLQNPTPSHRRDALRGHFPFPRVKQDSPLLPAVIKRSPLFIFDRFFLLLYLPLILVRRMHIAPAHMLSPPFFSMALNASLPLEQPAEAFKLPSSFRQKNRLPIPPAQTAELNWSSSDSPCRRLSPRSFHSPNWWIFPLSRSRKETLLPLTSLSLDCSWSPSPLSPARFCSRFSGPYQKDATPPPPPQPPPPPPPPTPGLQSLPRLNLP